MTDQPRPWSLGTMVKQWRVAANLTQRGLAELVDVGYPYISKIEADEHRPSLRVAESIAKVTSNSPDLLYPYLRQLPSEIAEIVARYPEDSFLLLRRMADRKKRREFELLLRASSLGKREDQP